ncbi:MULTISPECIES: metal ABC transporter permease [Halomonas]|uniref:metal ABC transporter permease n=1 Tax=Halomonas TaxID=2745 RepID=UPI001C967003|nr:MULTISPECIES: metal ABC transporter permease [Halomonas]MBY6208678.1 metal ABC transporter permease [Halomonas sp. DP3Y7-2]MBY6227149.1 metal ABC transporter permease [Halomonas sp. DP3Y7-1]MCA0915102.1 metal ABC transporter permease [Halomonas denitrificans]
MFDDFLVRAVLAGLGVALAAAPLGCFVVWRRMAYFGDATAHAAILGVALSLLLSTSMLAGVLAVSLLMAVVVSQLSGRGYAMDTLLGVMAHSALAFGLVAVSFVSGVRIDLMAYLFGDILAVGKSDLMIIAAGAILVVSLVGWRWSALLTATLDEDLARASGIDPRREQLVLTLSLAVVVAVALKVVGVLLIAALLIIPAAAARPLCRTPEAMALVAASIGACSTTGGLQAAYWLDTPTGPTIVSLAALIFVVTSVVGRLCYSRSRAVDPE